MTDDKSNIVQFVKKNKSKEKKPNQINWAATHEEESWRKRADEVIDKHVDIMMDILTSHMEVNEIVDISKLDLDQYHDLTLIRESISSLMYRTVGYDHDLHYFVDNMMIIPDPPINDSSK